MQLRRYDPTIYYILLYKSNKKNMIKWTREKDDQEDKIKAKSRVPENDKRVNKTKVCRDRGPWKANCLYLARWEKDMNYMTKNSIL